MKKLLFGLMLAAIAVGGSSFTNAREKRTISDNFLIQPIAGIFIRAVTANGSCLNLLSGWQCKYVVTDLGKWYIPSKTIYTTTDIDEYLDEGYLEYSPTSCAGLYIIL